MKAYWIALYTIINDQDNLKKYADVAIPILKKYGGTPLVRGGKYKIFSGTKFINGCEFIEIVTSQLSVTLSFCEQGFPLIKISLLLIHLCIVDLEYSGKYKDKSLSILSGTSTSNLKS